MTKKDKRNIPDLRIDDTRLREFMTLSSEAIWCFEIVPPVDTNLSLKQQTGLIFQNAILTEVNPAYARIAGYDDPNDTLGLRLNDMMPQSIPQNVATVEEFIQAGYNIDKVETVEPYQLEESRVLLNNGVGVVVDGMLVRAWGTAIDITDRKKLEEQLKQRLDQIEHLQKRIKDECTYLQEEIKSNHNFESIIGKSDALNYVLCRVMDVAPTDAPVMIMGETGTGKELIARAIHSASTRSNRALIKVNCAALSPSLIESELFGHKKGAFTGADAPRKGRFQLADGATLFLDEVSEIPYELQSKLLRVLQDGEYEPVGGSKTLRVDVRVIAASNRNLDAEVDAGRFRKDLMYRLNVFPLTVPPLRNRKEDIPLLVNWFVKKHSRKLGTRD